MFLCLYDIKQITGSRKTPVVDKLLKKNLMAHCILIISNHTELFHDGGYLKGCEAGIANVQELN